MSLTTTCQLLEAPTPVGKSLLIWRNSQVASGAWLTFDSRAVYVLGLDHVVTAIDKSSGTTLWRTQLVTSDPGRNGEGIMLASGRLIVGDIDLVALDPATGKQLWKYQPSVGAWPGYSTQWTDGTTIICGSATGHVYAVDAATGAERWVTHFVADTNTNVYSPAVVDGVVYVGFTHFGEPFTVVLGAGVAALDATTGNLLWATLVPRADSTDKPGVWADPSATIVTPTLVATLASDDKMYGFDRQTGAIAVSLPPSDFVKPGGIAENPTDVPSLGATGGMVVVASRTLTTLTALSASGLHRAWSVPFVFGSPTRIAVDATRIYSGAGGGQFAVYDLNGGLVWTINRGDLRSDDQEGLYFPPAIDTDRIYLAGNYEVYAFKKR